MKCGAGIPADRQLRGMRLILLIALSHSENRIEQIITQPYTCVISYGNIQPQEKQDGILVRWPVLNPALGKREEATHFSVPELAHRLRIICDDWC